MNDHEQIWQALTGDNSANEVNKTKGVIRLPAKELLDNARQCY